MPLIANSGKIRLLIEKEMKMRKSEKLSQKFERVLDLLNEAECTLQSIREISSADGERLNQAFIGLTGLVEDCTYEVCAPLQMEEDEKDNEILKLRARIADLENSMV